MNARPFSTTYVPTTAQTVPTRIAATSARTKNEYCSGSRIEPTSAAPGTLPGKRPGLAGLAARAVQLVVMRLTAARLVVVVGVVHDERLLAEHEQVAAIRSRQDVGIEHQRGGPIGDDRAVDCRHSMEPGRRTGQVVGRGDDGFAAPCLCLEDVH